MLVLLTNGEYSDYTVRGLVKTDLTVEEWNAKIAEFERQDPKPPHFWEGDHYRGTGMYHGNYDEFAALLQEWRDRLVIYLGAEWIDFEEWRMSDNAYDAFDLKCESSQPTQ